MRGIYALLVLWVPRAEVLHCLNMLTAPALRGLIRRLPSAPERRVA